MKTVCLLTLATLLIVLGEPLDYKTRTEELIEQQRRDKIFTDYGKHRRIIAGMIKAPRDGTTEDFRRKFSEYFFNLRPNASWEQILAHKDLAPWVTEKNRQKVAGHFRLPPDTKWHEMVELAEKEWRAWTEAGQKVAKAPP